MAFTRTSIINLAVMLLGHKPIQTLDNADDLVTAATQAYDMLLPSVLATGNWRFAIPDPAIKFVTNHPAYSNKLAECLLSLPSGYLKNIRIIPQNYVYEIYSDGLIYCNWGTTGPIYMEYAYQVPENQLPAPFVNYFIYEIACFCALASAQKPDYFSALETKRVLQWAIAASSDAQNRPQTNEVVIPCY